MSLRKFYSSFIKENGFPNQIFSGIPMFEGHTQQSRRQIAALESLIDKKGAVQAMEIGFNAGHSAELMLERNEELTLTSFDIGEHSYVHLGKTYIDKTYPSRHTLILGDSIKTVPAFAEDSDIKFDLIFIDGCHFGLHPSADLLNCAKLAHKDTIVIMDDTSYTPRWNEAWTLAPSCAWMTAVHQQLVVEIGRQDFARGRGMSWGKYLLKEGK